MSGTTRIDYSKLLGFASVVQELAEGVTFQNDAVSSRLGAKVGELGRPAAAGATADMLFQSDSISAKLGAKVGGEIT